MATPRQVSANRKNTEKSAGPKSTIGKNTFHLNVLRHILTAEEQILPGESRADFDLLEAQFYEEFPPENGLEDFLLGQLIACAWRLRRVAQVESGVFQHFQELIDNPPPRIVGIAGVSGEDYLPFDDGRGTDAGGGGAANWPTPGSRTDPEEPGSRTDSEEPGSRTDSEEPGSRTDSEGIASSAAAAAEAGATENSSGEGYWAGQASRAAQSGVTLPPEHSVARQPNDPAEHRSPYVLSAPLAPSAPANLGQAFLKASADTDAFAKIYRHETAIRAGFYRAYEELHRMRAVR